MTEKKRARKVRVSKGEAESRPPWRPTPGSTESSERTRVEILWGAQRLLASKGYAAFTMRGVAAIACLPLGTLTYHFKSKRDLLRAVIIAMLHEYEREIGGLFKPSGEPPKERFRKLVAWLIQDSTTTATNRLFREIWAMALHDPYVAESIDGLYEGAMALIALFLREVYPNITPAKAQKLTHLLIMVSEGAIPLYGTAPKIRAEMADVVELAQATLSRIADDLDSGRSF